MLLEVNGEVVVRVQTGILSLVGEYVVKGVSSMLVTRLVAYAVVERVPLLGVEL